MSTFRTGLERLAMGRVKEAEASECADPLRSPRVRALAMDIAYRLRSVCGDVPEGELVKLAIDLAVAQHNASPSAGPAR